MRTIIEIKKVILEYNVDSKDKKIEVDVLSKNLFSAVGDTINQYEGIKVLECSVKEEPNEEIKNLEEFLKESKCQVMTVRLISKWCMDSKDKKHKLIITPTGVDAIIYDILENLIAQDVECRSFPRYFDKVPGLELIEGE